MDKVAIVLNLGSNSIYARFRYTLIIGDDCKSVSHCIGGAPESGLMFEETRTFSTNSVYTVHSKEEIIKHNEGAGFNKKYPAETLDLCVKRSKDSAQEVVLLQGTTIFTQPLAITDETFRTGVCHLFKDKTPVYGIIRDSKRRDPTNGDRYIWLCEGETVNEQNEPTGDQCLHLKMNP